MPNAPRLDEKRVNQMLMSNGLGSLDDPGLIPQLRFLVSHVIKTHEQFRELINRCEGSKRYAMYEALHSALRFEPKPLDVYIAELGQIAEAQQLPIQQPDGTLSPFNVPEIALRPQTGLCVTEPLSLRETVEQSLEASRKIGEEFDADFRAGQREEEKQLAQELCEGAVLEKALEVVCKSCTKFAHFMGWNKDAAIKKARAAGWRVLYDTTTDASYEVCPKCVGDYWPRLKQ